MEKRGRKSRGEKPKIVILNEELLDKSIDKFTEMIYKMYKENKIEKIHLDL